jgi:uncharacterized protein
MDVSHGRRIEEVSMSTSSTIAPTPTTPSYRAVAPSWHTVILLLALFGLSFAGARTGNFVGSSHGRVNSYLVVMAAEWIMVAFVWWGVSLRGVSMSDLVGGRWTRLREVFRDIGIALAFLMIGSIVLQGLAHLLHAGSKQALRNVLPHSGTETMVWMLLAATAGICEEILCRGYLQSQFSALTHSAAGGILLQGIAFGAGHGYQGWKMMLVISVYGIIFGILAHWRRSLRPGMLAHFMQDGAAGLLARHLMR